MLRVYVLLLVVLLSAAVANAQQQPCSIPHLGPCSDAKGDQPTADAPPAESIVLHAGELTCVLGNESDHGAGRTGYIGIWSLTSVHNPRNAFFPRYAGWIQHRQRATVKRVSAREGVIQHYDTDGQPTTRQTFKLIAPYYFDCTFSRPSTGPTASFNGTSYMNGPPDPGVYFVDHEGEWQRHYDPIHGGAASIYAAGMPLPTLTKVPNARFQHGTNSFSDSVSKWRYDPDRALFYGRIGDMALVHMFPRRCGVIPYMSPSGGGRQPDGRKNPAWDWRGAMRVRKGSDGVAHFTMRAIYKKYVSDEDVLDEYRRWVATLEQS